VAPVSRMRRREFWETAVALCAMPAMVKSPRATAIRIEDVTHSYQDFHYRAPYKFGGFAVDRVTLLNVESVVSLPNGRSAKGFGSMTMGNIWSFPSRVMTYDQTLGAMKALAGKIGGLTRSYREYGHPIDLNFALEPYYLNAAAEVTRDLHLAEPIPKLCTLVTASPFDAALHDAFGKIHGRDVYQTYGPDLLPNDLSKYLGKEYAGRWLHQFLLTRPTPAMPLYHSVGALDPLTASEVTQPIHDGLPETLGEWIEHSGLDHIKIKLNGDDLNWDLNRVLTIDAVTVTAQAKRRVTTWFYSLDFNERCRDVEYLMRFIRNLKERNPPAFNRIQYVEQPTRRDLRADRHNVMHEASGLVPVVIDESLTGLDMLLLARDMGYTGAALKACKGQSQAVLMAAAGQIHKMFLCVQDLTCPGASLIQSAGLAAHVPGVAGIEANAREYVPAANEPWMRRFPGIFDITNGRMATETLTGVGLGAV
jgi:L-alanine-DL-glutamate epimerase-like enolase superfamily enzyme